MTVKKTQKNTVKKSKGLGLPFALCLLTVLVVILPLTFLCNIRNITTNGSKYYIDAEIFDAVGLYTKDNILKKIFFKKENPADTALEKMVMLENVKLDLELTGFFWFNLNIEVEDCDPKFAVNYANKYFVVSENNRIFIEQTEKPAEVCIVNGFQPNEPKVGEIASNSATDEVYLQLTQTLLKHPEIPITAVDMSNIYHIKLMYDNRIECRINAVDNLEYKLNYILKIIEKVSEEYETPDGYIIMREDNSASYMTKADMDNYLATNPEVNY